MTIPENFEFFRRVYSVKVGKSWLKTSNCFCVPISAFNSGCSSISKVRLMAFFIKVSFSPSVKFSGVSTFTFGTTLTFGASKAVSTEKS